MKDTHAQTFRAGVGGIILGKRGQVLAFERRDIPGSWQCPQGGLEEGETPLEAVRREILEETGIQADNLELIAAASRPLAYELPEKARTKKLGRGQVQYWFLFRFTGQEGAITLGNKKEFRAWKWMSMGVLVEKVVSFKQPVYQELARDFRTFLK